eukprot:8134591-Alexandrium_andersonii.AAC.1
MDSNGGHMLPNGVSIHRLGQHVGGIISARPLNDFSPRLGLAPEPIVGRLPDGAPARCPYAGRCQ